MAKADSSEMHDFAHSDADGHDQTVASMRDGDIHARKTAPSW